MSHDVAPTELKVLFRCERHDEIRVYGLRVVSPGLELWRVTETAGVQAGSVKEADLTSTDEAVQLLEEIRRSLRAGGWEMF
jgi:hypothetical protein